MAAFELQNGPRQAPGLIDVMAGDHDCGPLFRQVDQAAFDDRQGFPIEARSRLIQQQQSYNFV